MSEHGPSPASSGKAKSGGGKNLMESFVSGIAELGHSAGLGAVDASKDIFSDLFGSKSGGHGGGSHEKGH